MSKKFLYLHVILISILSMIAKYNVPELSEANWDTVLFLTPFGIINNYFHKEESALWTFYTDTSAGQLQLSTWQIILMSLVYLSLIVHVIYWFRIKNIATKD